MSESSVELRASHSDTQTDRQTDRQTDQQDIERDRQRDTDTYLVLLHVTLLIETC